MQANCELPSLLREMRHGCEPVIAVDDVSAGARLPIHAGRLYALRSGVVKEIWGDVARRGRIVDFCFPGHLIGIEASLGFGSPQKAYAAVQRASLCSATCAGPLGDPGSFPQALLSSELARRIVPVYALSWMIQADAATRVAHYIVKAVGFHGAGPGGGRRHVLPNIPRPDIADYLGLRPESVSRVLSQFRTAGWIRGKIDRIEVTNLDAVKAASVRHGLRPCCISVTGVPGSK